MRRFLRWVLGRTKRKPLRIYWFTDKKGKFYCGIRGSDEKVAYLSTRHYNTFRQMQSDVKDDFEYQEYELVFGGRKATK